MRLLFFPATHVHGSRQKELPRMSWQSKHLVPPSYVPHACKNKLMKLCINNHYKANHSWNITQISLKMKVKKIKKKKRYFPNAMRPYSYYFADIVLKVSVSYHTIIEFIISPIYCIKFQNVKYNWNISKHYENIMNSEKTMQMHTVMTQQQRYVP